jgi:hypothetical protein
MERSNVQIHNVRNPLTLSSHPAHTKGTHEADDPNRTVEAEPFWGSQSSPNWVQIFGHGTTLLGHPSPIGPPYSSPAGRLHSPPLSSYGKSSLPTGSEQPKTKSHSLIYSSSDLIIYHLIRDYIHCVYRPSVNDALKHDHGHAIQYRCHYHYIEKIWSYVAIAGEYEYDYADIEINMYLGINTFYITWLTCASNGATLHHRILPGSSANPPGQHCTAGSINIGSTSGHSWFTLYLGTASGGTTLYHWRPPGPKEQSSSTCLVPTRMDQHESKLKVRANFLHQYFVPPEVLDCEPSGTTLYHGFQPGSKPHSSNPWIYIPAEELGKPAILAHSTQAS